MADQTCSILVADDDSGQRLLLEMLLSLDGHRLELVEDGREALAYLREHTPDFAILDIRMSGMTGTEICDRMRCIERLRRVPVIILTGLRDEDSLAAARLARADRVVQKPLEGKDLRGLVRELLDTSRPAKAGAPEGSGRDPADDR